MKRCALRARSGDVRVARVHVIALVVDAVVGLTLGLIAHVDVVVFVVAILHRIFCIGRYTLYRTREHQNLQIGDYRQDRLVNSVSALPTKCTTVLALKQTVYFVCTTQWLTESMKPQWSSHPWESSKETGSEPTVAYRSSHRCSIELRTE